MKKLEALGKELQERTGIDFGVYRRPEVVSAFLEAIAVVTNPFSVIATIVKSLVVEIMLVNLALGYVWYVSDSDWWVGTLFLLVGNLGFSVVAIVVGVMISIRRFARRSGDAMIGALDLAELALVDLKRLNCDGRRIAPIEVVRGVLFVAVMPSVGKALETKAGFLAKPVSWALENVSVRLSDGLPKLLRSANGDDENKIPESTEGAFDKDRYSAIIAEFKAKIPPFIQKRIVAKVTLPTTIVMMVSATITTVLLALIYILLMMNGAR